MLKHRAVLRDSFLKIFEKMVQPALVDAFLANTKVSHSNFISCFLNSDPDDIRFPSSSEDRLSFREFPQLRVRILGVTHVGKSCILQLVLPENTFNTDEGVSLSRHTASLARTFLSTELQLQKISSVGDCNMFIMYRKIQLHLMMILDLWENLAEEMSSDTDTSGSQKSPSRTLLWVLRQLEEIIPQLRGEENGALEEDWIEDLLEDRFRCDEFPTELFYPHASLTDIPDLDWVLPVGSVITFHKERLMPGEDPALDSIFYGVVVNHDPRDGKEEPLRMDYIIMALTNTEFSEPSGAEAQTFQGFGVVNDAALWHPDNEDRKRMMNWLNENPQLDVWILFDNFDGCKFIPNGAFATRSFNDMQSREIAA